MMFISYRDLDSYLDGLDDDQPIIGNITFTAEGVFIDDVADGYGDPGKARKQEDQ